MIFYVIFCIVWKHISCLWIFQSLHYYSGWSWNWSWAWKKMSWLVDIIDVIAVVHCNIPPDILIILMNHTGDTICSPRTGGFYCESNIQYESGAIRSMFGDFNWNMLSIYSMSDCITVMGINKLFKIFNCGIVNFP